MKKKLVIAIVISIAAATAVCAQSLDVDYLDGTVELKTAKGWSAISIGDTLQAGATVRVSKGGSLEMSRGNKRITVVKDGTYAIQDLLKAGEKVAKSGVAVALTQKIRSVTAVGQQKTTSTTAGVRGAEATPVENLPWVDGDEDDLAEIRTLLDNGKYGEAIPKLQKALDESMTTEQEQLLKFYIATAYYGNGQIARAYREIMKTVIAAGSEYYPDYIILKAEVLLDILQYKESQTVLKTFIASKPTVTYAQIAYLLSAQCAKGLGDEKAAADALNAGIALDSQSDTAKEMKSILGGT